MLVHYHTQHTTHPFLSSLLEEHSPHVALCWWHGAALGMNWLHHSTPTIIHRDLKVRSV
jgi:hypothetical protein